MGILDSAAHAFLSELIDYAGLFPPAALTMEQALTEYARARGGPHAWVLGCFVVPASGFDALTEGLRAGRTREEPALPVSIVCDGPDLSLDCEAVGKYVRRSDRALRIRSIEMRLPHSLASLDGSDLPSTIPVFVELPCGERALLSNALDALAELRASAKIPKALFAKLRCGGGKEQETPLPEDVAFFIAQARERKVPFKLTAGLHHPVARWDPAGGLAAHGFLNVVGAAVLCWAAGLDARALAEMLRDGDRGHFRLDAQRFSWQTYGADAASILAARASFVSSFGNCDFFESIELLGALGVLPGEPVR
jgi:hypothetical protein